MDTSDPNATAQKLKAAQAQLQQDMYTQNHRRVSFGDLVTDRWGNARQYGFGEGSSMYDSALVLGDVKIGRHVWIGPGVVLDGSGGLVIGDYVSISAGVQIYTHHTVRWALSRGAEPIERAATTIGSGVFIGPNTVIQMGVRIGDNCVIGAMSLVSSDVPPNSKAWGTPARVVASSDLEPK